MKKWPWIVLLLLTILSLMAEFTMTHDPKHHHWWSSIPLFWIIFGFVGCTVIVFVAKTLGKLWLSKKEDYYDTK